MPTTPVERPAEPEPAESLESFTTRLATAPLAGALGLIAHRLAIGTRRGAALPEELKDVPKAALKKLADVLDLYADQLPVRVAVTTTPEPVTETSTPTTSASVPPPDAATQYLSDPDPGATYMNSGSAVDTSVPADMHVTWEPRDLGPSTVTTISPDGMISRIPIIGRPGPVNSDGYESEGGPGPMAIVGPPIFPPMLVLPDPEKIELVTYGPVLWPPHPSQVILPENVTGVARPFSTRRTAPATVSLLSPGPLTWPDHDSWSGVETFVQCGFKYLALYGHGLKHTGPPAWWFVAGTAAHAVLAGWERVLVREGKSTSPDDTAKVFGEEFAKEVERATASDADPYADPTTWLAAQNGKEGREWWEDNGPRYIAAYVTARTTGPESRWRVAQTGSGELMIEFGGTAMVGERPVVFYADQVLTDPTTGQLRIRDHKYGKSGPTAGAAQLDFYRFGIGVTVPDLAPPPSAVDLPGAGWEGDYWLGRSAIASTPKPLPFERSAGVVHRHVEALARAREHHVFLPNPGNFCGNCAVKSLCPAFTTDGKSIIDNG